MKINIYQERLVRMWFRVTPGLEIEQVEDLDLEDGDIPEWLDEEQGNVGWEGLLDIPYRDDQTLSWLLTQGLAPGQAFLMEIQKPRYTSSHSPDYGTEYDVEYSAAMIDREPWNAEKAATRWERWLRDEQIFRMEQEIYKQKVRVRQLRSPKHLFLHVSRYCSGRCCSDCCCGPHGIVLSLMTDIDSLEQERKGFVSLAAVRDDQADHARARRALLVQARLLFPTLSMTQLEKLPTRW